MGLDAGRLQAAQVLLDKTGARGNEHLAEGFIQGRSGARRARQVLRRLELHHVHLVRVDRNGDLVWPGIELRQHVARIVVEPLCRRPFTLRREGNRAADLQDHFRHGFAQPAQQLVEHGQPLRALAVGLAHVHVQHGGAGVIAVDRQLDLLVHRHGDIVGVARQVLGTVWRHLDDQLILVLWQQGVV
ncbi:hypothetical protein D3C72_1606280 [compost metagenome]